MKRDVGRIAHEMHNKPWKTNTKKEFELAANTLRPVDNLSMTATRPHTARRPDGSAARIGVGLSARL
jgi:hypothetical protein